MGKQLSKIQTIFPTSPMNISNALCVHHGILCVTSAAFKTRQKERSDRFLDLVARPPELSCSNSMHLSENGKKSKEHDDRGKDLASNWPGSLRVQRSWRALAFLIVFRLFCA